LSLLVSKDTRAKRFSCFENFCLAAGRIRLVFAKNIPEFTQIKIKMKSESLLACFRAYKSEIRQYFKRQMGIKFKLKTKSQRPATLFGFKRFPGGFVLLELRAF
jgi:hypothetical protein